MIKSEEEEENKRDARDAKVFWILITTSTNQIAGLLVLFPLVSSSSLLSSYLSFFFSF